MDLLPPELRNVAVLRILFAAVYLPTDLPNYWSVLTQFASQGNFSLQPQLMKIAVENLKSLNEKAFVTDKQLVNEIHGLPQTPSSLSPLGIILVPPRTNCKLFGGKLLV